VIGRFIGSIRRSKNMALRRKSEFVNGVGKELQVGELDHLFLLIFFEPNHTKK
jgi:hypothetical protein